MIVCQRQNGTQLGPQTASTSEGATVHSITSVADRPELLAAVQEIFDVAWSPTLMIPTSALA